MARASLVFAALIALVCASSPVARDECGRGVCSVAFRTSGPALSEDDALDRFELDEWFLPKLNIELPALFDWSAFDSAYYAHASDDADERTSGLC